mgnify:CR=1 FL=1
MNLPAFFTLVSAALLAVLAAAHLRAGERPQRRLFALAAIVLAAAHVSTLLMLIERDPERVAGHARTILALLVFFPALGIPFFATFARENGEERLARRLPWISAFAALCAVAVIALPSRFLFSLVRIMSDGLFQEATFTVVGQAAAAYLLLVNILLLHLFENTYRAASVADKVTLKYPFLGILTSSTVNVAVLSGVLAIAKLDRGAIAAHSCGVTALTVRQISPQSALG